jgi:UDP-N-acetylmuramoylalanine--D-glutamate ligase
MCFSMACAMGGLGCGGALDSWQQRDDIDSPDTHRMTPVTTFAGRTVAVFGLARSGIATALALKAGGATVACWDDGAGGREAAETAGLTLVNLLDADWSHFAALCLAPGVPLTHPWPHWTVGKARAARIPIIGDIELFFQERAKSAPAARVIAITGTNGKSTTTALIAHLLTRLGQDVQMGGNIGVGVLALEPPADSRIHVLELSSFQIDLTPSLNPTLGILLNITPDHLDRHGTFENYAAIKTRMVAESAHAVVGVDDDPTRRVSTSRAASGRPMTRISSETLDISLAGIASLRGAHNRKNVAAAVAAIAALGFSRTDIVQHLASFPGLAHRMEQLGHIGKTLIINDSKATNADSTDKALSAFARDIHWIVGGVQKEGGIEPLAPYFGRVARAYLVGKSSPEFAATLAAHAVPHVDCGTLDVALATALAAAETSDAAEPVVLLSPACASYDQYKSFEHRGDHFRALAGAHPRFVRG